MQLDADAKIIPADLLLQAQEVANAIGAGLAFRSAEMIAEAILADRERNAGAAVAALSALKTDLELLHKAVGEPGLRTRPFLYTRIDVMLEHVDAALVGSHAPDAASAGSFSSGGSPASSAGKEGDADRRHIFGSANDWNRIMLLGGEAPSARSDPLSTSTELPEEAIVAGTCLYQELRYGDVLNSRAAVTSIYEAMTRKASRT